MATYPIPTKRYWYPYGRVNTSSQFAGNWCSTEFNRLGLLHAGTPSTVYSEPLRTRFFSWTSDYEPIMFHFAIEFKGKDHDLIEDFAPGDTYTLVITQNTLLKEIYIDNLWQRSDSSIEQWTIDTIDYKWYNFTDFLCNTPIVDLDPVYYDIDNLDYEEELPFEYEYLSELEEPTQINIVTILKMSGEDITYAPIVFPPQLLRSLNYLPSVIPSFPSPFNAAL